MLEHLWYVYIFYTLFYYFFKADLDGMNRGRFVSKVMRGTITSPVIHLG